MIGTNIKRFRQQKNMSTGMLAKELKRKESVIKSWEKGISIPDENSIISVAKILNLSVDELLIPKNSKIVHIDLLSKEQKKIIRDIELAYRGELSSKGTECCNLEENKLKYLRKIYRHTQGQLALYLDVSRPSVNNWEMGLSKPSISDVVSMSLLYRTAPSYLLFRNTKESLLLTGLSSDKMDLIIALIDSLSN